MDVVIQMQRQLVEYTSSLFQEVTIHAIQSPNILLGN